MRPLMEMISPPLREEAYEEMKRALAEELRTVRRKRKLTQSECARLIGSSQSRVAKMESADGSVTLDLLIRGLLELGRTRREVAEILGVKGHQAA